MSEHTPGPWIAGYPKYDVTGPTSSSLTGVTVTESSDIYQKEKDGFGGPWPIMHTIVRCGTVTIAICPGETGHGEANARLIATVPDMFAMLKKLLMIVRYPIPGAIEEKRISDIITEAIIIINEIEGNS